MTCVNGLVYVNGTNYLFFSVSTEIGNLTSACNAGCSCDAVQYSPVCGVDKISYFAPCHAGCHSKMAKVSVVFP